MPRAHVCDITQIGRRLYPFRWENLLFSKFHAVLQISEELQKRFPSCSEELVEELANHLFRFVLQDSQRKCQLLLYVLCVSFFPFHGVKVPAWSGADQELILTDFLLLGRSGSMVPREMFLMLTPQSPLSWVSESFRQDIY